eukprot:gene415-770_t
MNPSSQLSVTDLSNPPSTDSDEVIPDKLIVVCSAEAYAMIAGGLLKSCDDTRDLIPTKAGWKEVHMRIVSDNVAFKFEAQQLMSVVREQKRFTTLRMIGSKKNADTEARVFADLAYVVGRMEKRKDRDTCVACLTKNTPVADACTPFLRQISEDGMGPVLNIINVTPLALRAPHHPETNKQTGGAAGAIPGHSL